MVGGGGEEEKPYDFAKLILNTMQFNRDSGQEFIGFFLRPVCESSLQCADRDALFRFISYYDSIRSIVWAVVLFFVYCCHKLILIGILDVYGAHWSCGFCPPQMIYYFSDKMYNRIISLVF